MTLPCFSGSAYRTLLGLVWIMPAFAAGESQRRFSLAAGDATETLPRFAVQADRKIVFSPTTVRGVKTNAVTGEYAPREALDLLVAHTGLVATQDAGSGVFAVRVETPDPNGPRATATKASDDRPRPTGASEETITLSPFEVHTDRDVGFVAASSLAGGRLAGDLRDTAAAYSVQTSEFIEALNLTDLNEAAQWTVNTGLNLDNGTNELYGSLFTSQSRGVASNEPQRNFFPLRFNADSYNLDRFDYARGPNAVLFGAGSVGGTANIVTKQAQVGRTRHDLRFIVGSDDNYRATMDDNLALGKKAALRINSLVQFKRGWRDDEFDNRRALHLAGTWQATSKIRVSAEVEWGRIVRNTPVAGLDDRVSGWDGVTVFPSVRTGNPAINPAALLDSQGLTVTPANNLAGRAPWLTIAPGLMGSAIFDFSGSVYTRGGAENANVRVGGVMVPAPFSTPNITNFPLLPAVGVPDGRLAAVLNSPIVPQVTKDFFRNLNASFSTAIDDPGFIQSYRTSSAFVNLKATERLFFELGANYLEEKRTSVYLNTRNLRDVYIDLTQTLPNGQPNPGYLQPFGEEWYNTRLGVTESKNIRLGTAYNAPATRWGDFLANLYGGLTRDRSDVRFSALSVTGVNPDRRFWSRTSTVNGVTFDPRIRYRYYWTLNPPGNRSVPKPTGPITVNVNGLNYQGNVAEVFDTNLLNEFVLHDRDLKYLQFALNWKLWKRRLVLLAASRHDWVQAALLRPSTDINHVTYLDPKWDGSTPPRLPAGPANYEQLSAAEKANYSVPAVDAAVTSRSTGLVFHAKPWVSLVGNYGESFTPNTYATTILGNSSPPRTSKGWDVGLRFDLLGGAIVANLTRYEGTERNETVNNNTQGPQVNVIVNANPMGNATDMNTRGMVIVPIAYGDRRDRQTKGYELELTANLWRNWRISANAARPESYQTNANLDTLAYLNTHDATLRQILNDAGVDIDPNQNASVRPGVTVPSADASAAANNWNLLQYFRRTTSSAAQRLNRQSEILANVFVDFTFREGALKGLRLGGGVNYRGREIIGNRGGDLMLNLASNAWETHPNASLTRYVYAAPYSLATLTMGYMVRVFKQPVSLSGKVDNVFDYDKVHYTNTVLRPDGGDLASKARVAVPNGFYYTVPRRFTLTVSTKF